MMEKKKPRTRSRNSPEPAQAALTSKVEAAKALHVNPMPGVDVDEAVADTIMRPGTAAARLVGESAATCNPTNRAHKGIKQHG